MKLEWNFGHELRTKTWNRIGCLFEGEEPYRIHRATSHDHLLLRLSLTNAFQSEIETQKQGDENE